MKLLWKLLRKHISIGQLVGFSMTNLIGVFIVLLSLQMYVDLSGIIYSKDNLFGQHYLVISKRFTTTGTILSKGVKSYFTNEEINEIKQQPFTKSLAPFATSRYQVGCYISIEGIPSMGTDMFFESVPNKYIDIDSALWKWDENAMNMDVPIVLPRTYLNLYNFGFAPTRSLPKIDEDTFTKIDLKLVLKGEGQNDVVKGRIIGFTDRLNTILVPESFMTWSNDKYASKSQSLPSRLILAPYNFADETIAKFMSANNYVIEDNKLDNSKASYFLRLITTVVILIGILITLLSLYILTLSIYLLIEKNVQKIQNLSLIGYTPCQISFPYLIMAFGLNTALSVLSYILMLNVRPIYYDFIWKVFPNLQQQTIIHSLGVAIALWMILSLLNSIIIYYKVKQSTR